MTLRSNCQRLLLLLLSFPASHALAYEFGLSVGQYEPFDGVVNSVYQNVAPSYLLRFGVPRDNGLSWSSMLVHHEFKSRIANLENDVRLMALQSGFRKTFLDRSELLLGIEPFFGASVGMVSLDVNSASNVSEQSYTGETKYGFSSAWEIGAQFNSRLLHHVEWEIKLTDLAVGRKIYGNQNMGGRILSFGFQYNLNTEAAH
jgi:hypothetical protein